MKSIITFLIFFIGILVSAQEKIAEFTTSHSQMAGYNMKAQVKFELYKDSLIMTQIDKRVVKTFKQKGLPLSTTYVHLFKKEETPYGTQYIFRNETEDFLIIIESKAAKPSVKIRNKDTFSGHVSEQLFFSI